MSQELRAAVETLRSSTLRLNKVTDLANETVREIEKFLNEECSVGIHTCVRLGRAGEGHAGTWLEYRRVGPRFRIALVEADPNGEDVSVKAWADSPREEKLESFEHLPALLTKIAERVEQELTRTEITAKTVVDTLAALRKKAN
jgi:hypothetical protein